MEKRKQYEMADHEEVREIYLLDDEEIELRPCGQDQGGGTRIGIVTWRDIPVEQEQRED